MTSRSSDRTDLRIFQIQDAIDLLVLDGGDLRVTRPDASGRVYLYHEDGSDVVTSIVSFLVED